MKNALRLLAAAVLTALLTVPFAGPAQAYPDPVITIDLSIPGDELIGGLTFDYTASASVECEVWTVSYLGADQTGSGDSTSGTFGTPPVDHRTPTTITATCEYDPTQAYGGGSAADVQAADTASASATVYLLPLSDGDGDGDDNGSLPGTGGSSQWILWAGLGLVVVGGGTVMVARRRSH